MKKMLKRTLSLILAMVMVLGLLPLNAMAAMIMDGPNSGRSETPVIDRSDPIVDTHATSMSGGHQRPEIPETPPPVESEEPVTPLWVNGTASAVINSDGSWTVTLTSDAPNNTTSRDWGVALIPNVNVGSGTALPSVAVGTLNGGNVLTYTGLTNTIKTRTGLDEADFVCVGGSDLRSDANGTFTVSSTDYKNMPSLDYLTGKFSSLSAPIDIVVVFFTKGSDAENAFGGTATHVKTTTTTYGSTATGIPSLVYTLNKANNTLTFESGTLAGSSWTPEGVTAGSTVSGWDDSMDRLTLPVYNRTGTGVEVTTGAVSPDGSGMSYAGTGALSGYPVNDGDSQTFALSVTTSSGVFTIPVTAAGVDAGGTTGETWNATITVKVINSQYTADEIKWEVTEGYDVSAMSDASKAITIHKPATATNVRALVNPTASSTGITATYGDSHVELDNTGVKLATRATSSSASNTYATAYTWDAYYYANGSGTRAQVSEILDTELKLALKDGLTANSDKTPKTYTFMVTLMALAPLNATSTAAHFTVGAAAAYVTIDVPVTIVVNPKQEEVNYTYKLVYDPNSGTGGPSNPATVTNQSTSHTFTLDFDSLPTRSGYTFQGWSDAANDSTPAYTASGTTTVTVNGTPNGVVTKTVYAIWKENSAEVTFDPNGGTWPDNSTTSKTTTGLQSAAVTEPTGGRPARTGYTFSKWRDETNNHDLATTDTYATQAGNTFKAQWTAKPVTVKYVTDHGMGPADESKSYNDSYTVSTIAGLTNKFGDTGWDSASKNFYTDASGKYRFDGWYLDTDDKSGATIDHLVESAGLVATDDSAGYTLTFTAKWTPVYTVTYANPTDTTPGSITEKSVNVVDGGTHYVFTDGSNTGNAPTPTTSTGYTFVGWSATDDSLAGSATYTASGTKSFEVTEDVTLYPVWKINQYTLTVAPKTGASGTAAPKAVQNTSTDSINTTGTNNSATVNYGNWVKVEASPASGYRFLYWTVTAGSGNVEFYTTESSGALSGQLSVSSGHYGASTNTTVYVKVTGDATVTANFEKLLTLTYNNNGATSVTMPDQVTDIVKGSSKTVSGLASDVTLPDGLSFQGWNTAANGSGTDYAADASITVNADATLYAQWKTTVAFDANGGTAGSVTSVSGVPAAAATLPTATANGAPTRSGYTFKGWGTANNTTAANKVTSQNFPAVTAPKTTLYAIWEVEGVSVPVKVKLDDSGWKDQTVTLRTSSSATTAAYTDTTDANGDATFNVTPDAGGSETEYFIFVGGQYVNKSVKVKAGETPDSTTVQFWKVGVSTDGHGSAKVEKTSGVALGGDSATSSSTTAATINVLDGAEVKWSYGTANTYYTKDKWDGVTPDTTSDQTATITAKDQSNKALFKLDTATVTVQLRVDGSNANPGRAVTVTPSGTNASDATPSGGSAGDAATIATTATSATFTVVQGSTYSFTVEGQTFSTSAAVGASGATVYVDYYTVTAKTDGNGTATVTETGVDTNTASTAASATAATIKVLVGNGATWTYSETKTNYVFSHWDTTTSDKATSKQVTVASNATLTHTANFKRDKVAVTITVTHNNEATEGAKVTLKQGTDTYTGTTDASGVCTVNVPSGSYTLTSDVDSDTASKSITVPDQDTYSNTLAYYTVTLERSFSDAPTFSDEMLVGFSAADAKTKSTVVLAGSSAQNLGVKATANNRTGSSPFYRFDEWTASVGTAPSAATANYSVGSESTLTAATVDATKGIVLTASFTRQYKVTLDNADKTDGDISGAAVSTSSTATKDSTTGDWTLYVDAGTDVDVTTAPAATMRTVGWTKTDGTDPGMYKKNSSNAKGDAITAASGVYVDTDKRNSIFVTPKGDVTLQVTWERDAFTGTINLVRADGTTAYTADNTKVYIELKDAASSNKDATTHVNYGSGTKNVVQTVASGTATNKWTDDMLLNNHTYQVWVNGYNTGKTIANTSATTTVKMFELTLDVKIDGQGDTVGDGSGTDYAPTDAKTKSTFKAGYAPNATAGTGAFFVPEASSVAITLDAETAGSGLRYRSVSADGTGNTFWTASAGTLANADSASTTLTLATNANGMADVTIYANYVSVLVLKVQAATPATGNVAGGSVAITAGGAIASDKLSTNIDKNKVATVAATATTSTAMDAYAFVDWTVATTTPAGAGKWVKSASDTDEDSGDRTATDFFAPSANTTLEATFKNLKATGATITGDTTTYPTANYAWDNTKGLTLTVKAGYTSSLTAPVDLSNLATAATKELTPSIEARSSLATGETDGSADGIITITTAGATINSGNGLAVSGATTTEVTFKTGLAIGTYVANLKVTDGDVTVTVPVTVKVEAPEEFAVSIKTFPDGVSDPSGDNILSVILVPTAGTTAKSKGNIVLTDTDNDGVWEGEAWWDGTYRVYVDGYATSTSNNVTNQAVYNGGTVVSVDVKDLYTVSFAKEDYKDTDDSTVMGLPSFVTIPAAAVKDDVSVVTVKPKNDVGSGEYSAIVVAAGGQITLTHGAQSNESDTNVNHYVLDKWQQHVVTATATATAATVAAGGAYTVDATAPATDSIAPIFVDPVYAQRYKLTLGAPGAAGDTAPTHAVGAKFGNSSKKSDSDNFVWVTKGDAVEITSLLLDNTADRSNFIFSHWSQNHDDDDDAAGTFTASGTAKDGDITFTPAGDTTLTPNYWLKPTISGTDYYHLNVEQDKNLPNKFSPQGGSAGKFPDGTTVNDLPKFVWTQNDATLDEDAQFQIWLTDTNGDGDADESEWVTLDEDQVTRATAAGKVTFTVTLDYLKTLTVGDGQISNTYDVRVKSHTPDADTDNHPNGEATIRTSKLTIYVTPEPLTEVNIWVEDETSATASVDDTDRDLVKYKDHKDANIVKDNKLTWTWYVSDPGVTKAQLDGLTHQYVVEGQFTAAQNAKYATDANNAADTLGSVVQAASSTWATASQLDVTDPAYKGRYIYAVVAASQTGYGAVITNAIAVDYDAAIKVTKDASANIDEEGYRVFLVPNTLSDNDLTVNATTGALEIKSGVTGKGEIVEATWESDNLYTTEESELKGGMGYNVYVNKVESDFTKYEDTTKDVTGQIDADSANVPTVEFFSVNYVPTYVHDAVDSAGTNVGEDFGEDDKDAVGITAHITGTTTLTVDDGVGVLTGSSVTVKTVNKTWKQDYNVDWQNATTEPTGTYFASYPNTGVNSSDANVGQTKTEACDTGTVLSSVTKKTWVGAQLDQNVYTVSGNVWVNGGVNTGGVVIAATDVKRPYLSFQNGETTYVFRADGTGGGKHKNTVTIKGVPKKSEVEGSAITGEYAITAEPLFGSIIKKYIPGQNVTSATDTSIAAVNALGGDNSNTLADGANITAAPVFTIVVEASKYVLTIPQTTDNTKATHETSSIVAPIAPPNATQTNRIASASWTQSFGYDYAAGATTRDYTFTLINEGNTVLDVSLSILKSIKDTSNAANNGYIYGAQVAATGSAATALTTDASGTKDSFNGVIFEGLDDSFVLQAYGSTDSSNNPTDRVSFTVKVPEGLDVSKVASYAFQFTSIEYGTDATGVTTVYGPAVTYQLTQTINPLAIEEIKVDATSTPGTYKPTDLKIGGQTDTGIPSGALDEVEYVWYVAKKGETVSFSDSGVGSLTGGATFRGVTAAGVASDTSYYTLQSADQGMTLYLLARNKDKGNVVKAAYTKVGDLPFDLDIVVKHNADAIAASLKGNYKVYLWAGTGALDLSDTTGNLIEATATASNDGIYTAKGLDANKTYKIYTNAVGGAKATASDFTDSGVTASLDDLAKQTGSSPTYPTVVYHDVILNNTTVTNGIYDSAITANGTKFLKAYATEEADRSNSTLPSAESLVAPTAKFGTTEVATSDVNKWVQENVTVDLSYANWNRDYKLEWNGVTTGATVDTAPASGDVGGTGTLKVTAAKATVKTKLTLNLYSVTVYVVGDNGGSVDEIKLTNKASGDEAFNFTTLADYTDTKVTPNKDYVTGMSTAQTSGVGVGSTAVFSVPGGDYTVSAEKAAGSNLEGYLHPHTTPIPSDMSGYKTPVDVSVSSTATTDTADVVVVVAGQAMQVTDDSPAEVGDQEHNTVAGSGNNAAAYDGTDVSDGTYTRTITLPYGYAADSFDITVTNTSAAAGNIIHNVTMAKTSTQLGPNNEITIADAGDAVSTILDGTQDMDKGDATKIAVAIAAGLPVDTYTSKLTFTFETEGTGVTGNKTATVTYNLVIKVEEAKFTAVTVKASDGSDISTMVPYGVALEANTYTTQDHDLYGVTGVNAISEKTADNTSGDYTYQWYYSDPDKTATESWTDGVVTVTDGYKVTDDGTSSGTPVTGTTLSADVIKLYQGKKLYLVITAENGKNVTEAAISDPVTTGFQPVVKIAVDDVAIATEAEPTGYVVVLVDKDNKEIPTVWDGALKGYVPVDNATDQNPVYLPSGNYSVKVGAYTGAAAATVTLASATQTTAFANYTLSVANPTATALYYTVNAVNTKAFEGIAGQGDDSFDDDGAGNKVKGPAPVFTLNGDASVTITSGVTGVLKNQKVDAKMPETATNSGKGWTQDYKLTWFSKADGNLTGTTLAPTFDTAYQGTSPDLDNWGSGKQTAATAVTTGYSSVTVSNTLFIGGRLDQNVYTITGAVVSDDNSGAITEVKVEQLKDVDGTQTATTLYTWDDDLDGNLVTDDDKNGDGSLQPGETVTFKVVAGKYTITSTPNSKTVIDSVTWEPNTATLKDEGTVGSDRKGVLAGEEVAADWDTKSAYAFQIKVTGASVDLGVTDEPSADAQNVAAKSSATNVGDRVVVRYFDHIGNLEADAAATGTTVFPLMLENDGNVDLATSLSVYHFANKTGLNQSYYNTDSNWEADNGGNYVNTPIFTSSAAGVTTKVELAISAAGALHVDDPDDANDSVRTVLTLENVLKSGTSVLAGADYKATYAADDVPAVDGAKLTLGEDAWSRDSGVFVFRFKGTSDSGDAVVYYVLDLTVKQLPIVETSTQMKDTQGNAVADTAMPGAGYKLQAKGYDAAPDNDQSLANVKVKASAKNTNAAPDVTTADDAGLQYTASYKDLRFAWVSVPKDSIPAGTSASDAATIRQTILGRFTVNTTTGDLTTSYTGYKVLAVDSKEYEVKAPDPANGEPGDLDRDIYLITYAPNTDTVKTNAESKAISDIIRTKRTVGVHIKVNGTRVPSAPVSTDPGYRIFLVEDGKELSVNKNEDGTLTLGEGTWATTWNNKSQGMYQAPIDMGTTYHVYAPMFLGSDAYVDTDLILGLNSASDEVDVPYRTVAHIPNVAVDNTYDGFSAYLPDSTGDTDKELQNALSVMVSDDKDVASYTSGYVLPKPTAAAPSVPVLEGMRLKVTVDATAETGEDKSWSEHQSYHTMSTVGWQKDSTAAVMNTTKQDGIAYPAGVGDPAKYLVQSGDIVVDNAAMSFSATLKQELFTVTFEVVDDTPSDVTVPAGTTPALHNDLAQTTLTTDKAKEPDADDIKINAKSITNGKNSVQGADGATVTFEKVPAGALVIFAKEGNRTSVDGYHWRSADDTEALDKGDIVQVTAHAAGAVDKNQHSATDSNFNTIHIQFSNYAVVWADNFDPANGEHYEITEGKTGFQKKDTPNTPPYLALLEGYTARDEDTGKGDVLTYTVRVKNSGAVDLEEFRLSLNNNNFDADLAHVRYSSGGELVKLPSGEYDTINVGGATSAFTLVQDEFVEFEVTIPLDQPAQKAAYDSIFTVLANTVDNAPISNSTYSPGYQVKPIIDFDEGTAKVIYGNNAFETNQDIDRDWDTDAYNPNFKFTVLNEEELAEYLDGAARHANAYTSDGVTASGVTTGKLPDWVALNENSGLVTFDATKRATEVNVQTKAGTSTWDDYTDDEVENEIIFYIKAVDQETQKEYFTTYTINVEPGQLDIVGANWTADPDDVISGQKVDMGAFTYDRVTNLKPLQPDSHGEDVIAAADIAGQDANNTPNNTALGNTDAKNKTVETLYPTLEDKALTAEWSVSSENNDERYLLGEHSYQFTVTYKPGTAERWNYKPVTETKVITAKAPDRSLEFSDKVENYDDVKTVLRTDDDTVYTDEPNADGSALESQDYHADVARKYERITYLDKEPKYTIRVKKIGTFTDLHLTENDGTVGFKVVSIVTKPDDNEDTAGTVATDFTTTDDADEILEIQVELTPVSGSKWVGQHKIGYTATGVDTQGETVSATYELIIVVDPKVITKLDVKVTDGEDEPDAVTGRLEGDDPDDPDRDLTEPDSKGNPPVKTTEVTWTPEDPEDPDDQPDGKHTGVEVTVEIDPNYIYVKDDPETDDDEDITEHTTLTPDKPTDPDAVVVERDETDGDHIVHIKQTIPYLMHSDVKVGTTPSDTTGPKVDDTRTVSGFTTDDTNLGQYDISLGGYPVGTPNGKIYDVEWAVDATSTLPGIGAKLVDATGAEVDFTALTPVDFVNSGDHLTLTLDMSEVDIPAAGAYTLKLKAEGAATKGGEKNIQSTYTITVNVGTPVPGDLKYADAKAADGSDAKGPADEVTRTVRIAKNAKPEALTTHVYDVYLSAVGHLVYGVTVEPDRDLPEGWTLTPSVEDYPETVGDLPLGDAARHHHVLDLTGVSTAENGTTTVVFTAKGYSSKELYERSKTDATVLPDVDAIYKVEVIIYTPASPGGSTPDPGCPNQVTYLLGVQGTTNDPVMEMVAANGKVSRVPSVNTLAGYKFLGWSLKAPTGDLNEDAKRQLTEPKSLTISGNTTFYAVYQKLYDVPQPPFHEHYVIGYPNGNFGPADNIDRASVATIIARAVLPNFVEGADYGNPGGYSDVDNHWAASAIAYCSKYGVFQGYDDGSFRPSQPITRQELALVMARLTGVQGAKDMPFSDISDAGAWAMDGIYTAYANGWVNGYNDGTFKPLNPIRRDETVKMFNAYLRRGVDAEGLGSLTEYVHSGVASNNTENGTTEYMTWPDVSKDQWAYYEIIEAANDHEFKVDATVEGGYTVPEDWDKCWIDEKWRYHDDLTDGGPVTGLLAAGFRIWSK